ncbi:UDP-glycosyltransferase 73C3-like [Dioscorea cayenensis subsp. rotundata]|uniref:UDP-glycosyltransferase 73C3-like n=1 Tax=Dioscorea cayennensis subsp. rotundata TaxID=55577 RepID=A0AB40CV94_DIOCR|nr:UDP-glycosyltransferase 73C3-like [Dioscorea cayenensis subsp. rotundata]
MTKQTTIINGFNNNTTTTPPHVVIVPLMAQGHIIPMLDMARLLAERGVLVTFITTPVNASRIKPIIARMHESNLHINFIELPFPCAEAGLPLGCEKLYVFQLHKIYETVTDEFEEIAVPGLTDNDDDVVSQSFKVCKLHAPGWFNAPGLEKLRDEALHAEETADGVVCAFMLVFGSLARMKVGQILEIGSGLEASGVPSIWVIKDVEMCSEVEEWLEGFQKRMSLRSFVIKGWAPQAVILSHKAVGGFVSHCGWNSTLEAVSNGVPMITWPQFVDQFLNERLVVELLRIGIAIGVKKPVFYYGEDEIPVKKDDVERAVRSLMGDGVEAEERRIRAREIKKKAIKAMEEGAGSSYENITRFVEYIKHEPCKDVQGTAV